MIEINRNFAVVKGVAQKVPVLMLGTRAEEIAGKYVNFSQTSSLAV